MLRISVSDLTSHVRPFRFLVAAIAFRRVFPLAVLATFIGFAGQAHAQIEPACEPEMARLTSVQGTVEIRPNEGVAWRRAELNDILCMGATIRVAAFSRAALAFTDDSTLRLDQDTTLTIREREDERRTWLDMLTGAIHFFSHRPRSLKVDTPFVNAAAEGTEFLIRINKAAAHILMYEGMVLASNEAGQLRLGPDDAALIRAGEKPIPEIVVRPRDAVAWAVHYPPVLAILADRDAPGALRHEVKNALEWLDDNNYRYALRSLDKIPKRERTPRNEVLRAGILLNIGRVEEAEAAIERALTIDAEAADAYALRTILHVTRNDRAQALRDAERAVTLAPNSSTALIAQSYARQASFDLEGARESLRAAVEKNPNDALAYARLSEIELSFGDIDRASAAAAKATRLAPNLARTQTVRGFSHLADVDIGAARTAFTRAIELESTDPLPHLGQGLAKIRDGNLETGRRDLEVAASLDPNNALIRSYLGKAYFEEKRGPKDATQFDIAKKLDPNDPTPWFYDAIRKQTENRPIEALRDLEKAIELNDNRAVYRSSLLLDQDLATRGVSLARIFDDLGFEQLAVNEASRSVSQDPASHSAHRFLSDAYMRLSRHEIARISNLRQAQLLQPINANPVQPGLSIIDLNTLAGTGPANAAFNEFHSLFERNKAMLTASGIVGSNNDIGDEIIASGIWNKYSFSVGQLFHESNGFRSNNDGKDEIYNIFAQFFINSNLSLQAEFVNRNSEFGDLFLNFDLDRFSENTRFFRNEKNFHFGGSLDFNTHNKMIFSLSIVDQERENLQFFGSDSFSSIVTEDGLDFHVQNYFRKDSYDILSGANIYRSDGDFNDILRIGGDQIPDIDDFSTNGQNAYVYVFVDPVETIRTTLGLSYDRIEEVNFEEKKLNPKFGVEWDISDIGIFRSAYFKTTKRRLITDTTLEHTTIAGFNQLFDDINGTTTDTFGIGLDFFLPWSSRLGFSFQERRRSEPRTILTENNSVRKRNNEEMIFDSYLYIPITKSWSFFLEPRLELFDSKSEFDPVTDIRTFRVPFGVRYFSRFGIFLEIEATYVDQEIERINEDREQDKFIAFDTAVGWRLPKRAGILTIEAKNILNQNFQYQDKNFLSVETYRSRFSPESSILGKLTLNF